MYSLDEISTRLIGILKYTSLYDEVISTFKSDMRSILKIRYRKEVVKCIFF